ncbi:hypothetical protein D3C81_931080 [compost metagenome]
MPKITAKEKQYTLVDHLLTVGWKVNHEYLDNKVTDKYDGDLKRAMWGEHNDKFYLISNCENYTCTVEKLNAEFWRMKPHWRKLGKFRIGATNFTSTGITYSTSVGGALTKTMELVLPEFEFQGGEK